MNKIEELSNEELVENLLCDFDNLQNTWKNDKIKECLDKLNNTKKELLSRLTLSQEKVVEEFKKKLIKEIDNNIITEYDMEAIKYRVLELIKDFK